MTVSDQEITSRTAVTVHGDHRLVRPLSKHVQPRPESRHTP
jgi:hypothetical protein